MSEQAYPCANCGKPWGEHVSFGWTAICPGSVFKMSPWASGVAPVQPQPTTPCHCSGNLVLGTTTDGKCAGCGLPK